jgi:hypothetical protein
MAWMLSLFCFIWFVYGEVTLDDLVAADNDWGLKAAVVRVIHTVANPDSRIIQLYETTWNVMK